MAKKTKSSVSDPKDMGSTDKIPIQEFLGSCSTPYRSEEDGVITLINPHFTGHLFLNDYAREIFSNVFVRIEVDYSKNEIRFWGKHGERTLDKDGNPIRDEDGNLTFTLGRPDMVIRGLLKE